MARFSRCLIAVPVKTTFLDNCPAISLPPKWSILWETERIEKTESWKKKLGIGPFSSKHFSFKLDKNCKTKSHRKERYRYYSLALPTQGTYWKTFWGSAWHGWHSAVACAAWCMPLISAWSWSCRHMDSWLRPVQPHKQPHPFYNISLNA